MKGSITIILILILCSSFQQDQKTSENQHSQLPPFLQNINQDSPPTSLPEKSETVEKFLPDLPQLESTSEKSELNENEIPSLSLELPSETNVVVEEELAKDDLISKQGEEQEESTKLHLEAEETNKDKISPPPAQKVEDGSKSGESGESSSKENDSIPSFSEWTKLQLAMRKELSVNNIKNKTLVGEGKNFAAPDCGAKVINSNSEAQNPSGVLSSSHDEYMLNRCTSNTWFIVELCEPLKIETVALGNLELFSSNPQEIELGVSDRYPTRDWTILGPYTAPDSRSLHSFHLEATNSTFGKFLRVIVRKHYGNEHYCPLSLLKVFGRSEYEVLESETTHREDMEASSSNANVGDENEKGEGVEKSVIGSVLDMVKSAASALVKKDVHKTENSETNAVETDSNGAKEVKGKYFISLLQCIPTLNSTDTNSIPPLSSSLNLHTLQLLSASLSFNSDIWANCHSLFKRYSVGAPHQVEGLLISVYGLRITSTLCHFLFPIHTCAQNGDLSLEGLEGGNRSIEESFKNDEGILGGGSSGEETKINYNENGNNGVYEGNNGEKGSLEGGTSEEPAQKESVFVRLSNRIKNLERNQSLSSDYLEELSRRFKRQNEEIHSAHEQFRRTLNESMGKCAAVEEALRYEVRRLNRNIETLRELLLKVELQRSGLFLISILQLICSFFCWWSGRTSQKLNSASLQTSISAPILGKRGLGSSESLHNSKKIKRKRKKNTHLTQIQIPTENETQNNETCLPALNLQLVPISNLEKNELLLPRSDIGEKNEAFSPLAQVSPKNEQVERIKLDEQSSSTIEKLKLSDKESDSFLRLQNLRKLRIGGSHPEGARSSSTSESLCSERSSSSPFKTPKKSKIKSFFFGK